MAMPSKASSHLRLAQPDEVPDDASGRPAPGPWWKEDGDTETGPPGGHPAGGWNPGYSAPVPPADPATPPRPPGHSGPGGPQPATSPVAGHSGPGGPQPATSPAAGPVAGPATGPTATGAAIELAEMAPFGRNRTAGERMMRIARHWTNQAADNAARPGGLAAGIIGEAPPSLTGHWKYVASRAWVPDEHPGGFISPAGATYGYTLGTLGVAIGLGIAWAFHKPMRLALVVLIGGIAALIAILCLHLT